MADKFDAETLERLAEQFKRDPSRMTEDEIKAVGARAWLRIRQRMT